MSASHSLPVGTRGLELHTPDRVWELCVSDEKEFVSWLQILSRIVQAQNLAPLLCDW